MESRYNAYGLSEDEAGGAYSTHSIHSEQAKVPKKRAVISFFSRGTKKTLPKAAAKTKQQTKAKEEVEVDDVPPLKSEGPTSYTSVGSYSSLSSSQTETQLSDELSSTSHTPKKSQDELTTEEEEISGTEATYSSTTLYKKDTVHKISAIKFGEYIQEKADEVSATLLTKIPKSFQSYDQVRSHN